MATLTLAKAMLGASSQPRPHYRRSTKVSLKAPRKRTFLLYMEKHNAETLSSGCSGSQLCRQVTCSHADTFAPCHGGADNGNNAPRPPCGTSGGDGSAGGDGQPPHEQAPLPRALVVGAATLLSALVLLPSQQAVASGPGKLRLAGTTAAAAAGVTSPRSSSSSGVPAHRAWSLCLNHQDRGSGLDLVGKLVGRDSKRGAHKNAAADGAAIVYGHVTLTEEERRLLARSSRQLFFNECVRVGCGSHVSIGRL